MCIIIHKPPTKPLYKKRLERLWKINSDGGGIAFVDPISNVLEITKQLKWEEFWREYRDIDAAVGEDSDIVIHMRIATHGSVCAANTHPFRIDEHTAMAHNGILSGYTGGELSNRLKQQMGEEDVSDTRLFIEDIIKSLPANWLDSPGLVRLVKEYIGTYNKMVFITSNPELKNRVYVLNANAGVFADGLWFSNGNGVHDWSSYQRKNQQSATSWSYDSHGKYVGTKVEDRKKTDIAIELPTRNLSAVILSGTQDEWRLLQKRKFELGIVTPIALEPLSKGNVWCCMACEAEISLGDGYCLCWETICTECEELVAVCPCNEDGTPGGMIIAHTLWLADKEKDKEEETMRQNKKINELTQDDFENMMGMAV